MVKILDKKNEGEIMIRIAVTTTLLASYANKYCDKEILRKKEKNLIQLIPCKKIPISNIYYVN